MANLISGAAGKAGQAATDYAASTGGAAIGGAVMDQATKAGKEAMGDMSKLGAGDVAGQASKAATNAVQGVAGDVTKRMTGAGEGVMNAGSEALNKGAGMMENIMDTAELAKLTEDMGEWAEKHPKLAVLGIPKAVLGIPGLVLFAFFTVVIFVISLVLALVLALVVAVLFLVVFILITLLVIFPLFLTIFLVAIFGAFWGLLFYFMVVKKAKKKYGHLIPDAEKFELPNVPSQEPVFKRGTKHKLPAKKDATPPKDKEADKKSMESSKRSQPSNFKKGTKSKLPSKKKSDAQKQEETNKTAKDFPNVPQHDPGQETRSTGSDKNPNGKPKRRVPRKQTKEQPIRAE